MQAALTEHIDDLAIEPDGAMGMARPGLRERLLEESFRAGGIDGIVLHDLSKHRLGIDKQDAIIGIDGRTVPPGPKLIGDSLERAGSGHEYERIARVCAFGEKL